VFFSPLQIFWRGAGGEGNGKVRNVNE
jgi:hypothetical protein